MAIHVEALVLAPSVTRPDSRVEVLANCHRRVPFTLQCYWYVIMTALSHVCSPNMYATAAVNG